MRFFTSTHSGLAVAIAMAAVGVPRLIGAQPRSVRPHVALEVSLLAGAYRGNISPEQATALETSIADSARAIVRELYPFLDWAGGADASDTVVIRVVDKYDPADMQWSRLELTIRAGNERRLRDSSAYHVEFEPFRVFSRRAGPSAWTLNALLADMGPQLRRSLATPSLLTDVFGRIPLSARVRLTKDGQGLVEPHARDIGASETQNPTFKVRARVIDLTSDAVGEFDLVTCKAGREGFAYSCAVTQLEFPQAGLTLSGARLDTVLRRDSLTPRSLLLKSFLPDPLALNSGASNPNRP